MKIYLACSSKSIKKYLNNYEIIRKEILSLGHKIPNDWLGRLIDRFKKKEDSSAVPDLKEESLKAIDNCDCLIADVSIPSASVGFQIGYALSNKIPTLCLYSSDFGAKKPPQVIDVSDASNLKIEEYNLKNIKSIIRNFLLKVPSVKLIKFNFIITPEIEMYLTWGARTYGVSKSEFLRRKVIDEVISKDKKFPL